MVTGIIGGNATTVIVDGSPNTIGRDSLDVVRDKTSLAQKTLFGGLFSTQLYAEAPITAGAAVNFKEVDSDADFYLPIGSQIWGARYKVATTFTSATDAATLSIGIPTDDAAGIVAATAISTGTTWDATTKQITTIQGDLAFSTASETVVTTDKPIALTAAIENVTAGKVFLWILWSGPFRT